MAVVGFLIQILNKYCTSYYFWQFLIMAGSHNYLFWQKSPVELITIGSRPSRGHPSTFFGVFATPQFVQALFTVYLLHELKVPGRSRQNTRQSPWARDGASASLHRTQAAKTAPPPDNALGAPSQGVVAARAGGPAAINFSLSLSSSLVSTNLPAPGCRRLTLASASSLVLLPPRPPPQPPWR